MASIPSLLLDILLELEKEDLYSFQWHIYNDAGPSHIPKAKIKHKNWEDTVDILVQTFGNEGAVRVTVDALSAKRFNQLAEELKERYKKGKVDPKKN